MNSVPAFCSNKISKSDNLLSEERIIMFTYVHYSKYLICVLVSLCSIQQTVSDHCANECNSTSESSKNGFLIKTEYPATAAFEKNGFYYMSFTTHFLASSVSSQCKESLDFYFKGLIDLKPWAIEMLDASGKLPSGFSGITMIDYGSLDDCIKTKAHSNDDLNNLFKGKFCMVHLHHPLFQTPHHNPYIEKSYVEAFGVPPDWIRSIIENNMIMRFGFYGGMCVPSTCTDDDLYNVTNALAEPLGLDSTLTDCQVEEPRRVPIFAKIIIISLVVLILVCVSGTVIDLNDRKKEEKGESLYRDLLKAFSFYSNVEELFTVSTKKASLDCIHGMRVILCLCIMQAHAMMFPTLWKELRYRNMHFVYEVLDKKMFMENNGLAPVAIFITISAFLLVYTSWKKLEESGGHMNVLENIIQKYCRLTPPHIFVILLSFLLPIFNSGPIWNSTWEHENQNCYHNGWKNLINLQNHDDVFDICLPHTWYVGAAMQIFTISLPLMIATYRYPKAGVFLGLILFFGSIIYFYHLSIESQYPFMAFNSLRYTHLVEEIASKIYNRTSYHHPSNLIGMLFGWLYLKYGKRKLPKMWLIAGWSFGILCLVFGQYAVYIPTKDLRIMAFYNTTKNSAMALGTCWMIYACASGQGGVLDKIFSLKALVPLSRMSYSIFLVHPLYLIFRDASNAERYYMDKMSHAVELTPFWVISIFAGFFVYILVEEPFNKVYNILKKRKTSSTISPNDNTKIGN